MTSDTTKPDELDELREQVAGAIGECSYELLPLSRKMEVDKILELFATHIAAETKKAELRGYDANRQGSWIFIGDGARLNNLDDLYWSYVMEQIAKFYDNYTLDYCKHNMKFAGFGKVGIHKMLAQADQIAKERIAHLQKGTDNE